MKLLLDADFLVGLAKVDDIHHREVIALFRELKKSRDQLFLSNLVVQEVGTVLSHKTGPVIVRSFYEKLPKLGLLSMRVDRETEDRAWEILLEQKKKGCSFVDCSNLALIEKYKIDKILSFDRFYPKELRLG